MTLTEAIKAHINEQVQVMLDGIDLDKEVEKYVSKESIRSITEGAIEGEILNQVTKAISMSIRQAILERQPLIDAMTNSKVMALLMGYTQFIDKVENDVNKNVKEKQNARN